jgi:hypothetical protein
MERINRRSFSLTWAILPGVLVLAACSSSKNDPTPDQQPEAGVVDAPIADLPSGEAGSAEVADATGLDSPCAVRGESTCAASAGCFAIRAVPFVEICQGGTTSIFAGCVSGGPDGGPGITWGRQDGTGQIVRFPTTQMPAGWTKIAEPSCTPDGGLDTPHDDAAVMDAGACRGDEADLYTRGWIGPCPSLVDAEVPVLYCQSPGIGVFEAECGPRRTLRWDWGTHAMTCFYEQGTLVGLLMTNDTPAFCSDTSRTLRIGSTEECPSSTQTLLINCDPFQDGGYFPYLPG